jgi:hypothetical protein
LAFRTTGKSVPYRTGIWSDDPKEHARGGRLSSAVRTQKRKDLARVNLERQPVHCADILEVFRDAIDLEDHGALIVATDQFKVSRRSS